MTLGNSQSGWPAVLFALLVPACSLSDGVLGRLGGTGGSSGGDGGHSEGCAASPVVTLQGHQTCTSRLASARFSNALCSCGQTQVTYGLSTHGFDSRQGAYETGQADDSGASVGINGKYTPPTGATDVGGSLSLSGNEDMQFVGLLKARGDLYAAGNITGTGAVRVSRNAWLGGSLGGLGTTMTVGGDLHYSGSVNALPLLVSGTNQKETVTVRKPCPCEASDLLDIESLVDEARTKNDDDNLGISRDVLASVAGSAQLSLSCGRAYLSQISGVGNVTVHVTGAVALFIDGSINLTGSLSFDVAPGAEVDVFVKKDLAVQGLVSVGSKERPGAGRVWVAGSQGITLMSPWIGNLYAPRARVSSVFALEVWGSLFAGEFFGGASASFVFDRAVTAAQANCSAPQPPSGICSQCQWCSGGSACVSGSCRACQKDSDCCSLSVCSNGSCVPWIDLTPAG